MSLEIENINRAAHLLKERIAGINEWIQNNQEITEPNMYEYTNVLAKFGEIIADADEYYKENGYPENIDSVSGHYEIYNKIPELNAINVELRKLIDLRKLNNREDDPAKSFVSVPEVRDFLNELEYRTFSGEYRNPKDTVIASTKKEILSKCMGVSFYIWQMKKNNPEFKYDNEEEYNALKMAYNTYSESEGIQIIIHDANGNTYEGPQFGNIIENIMKYIDKNYIYSEENENDPKKVI